MRHQTAQQVFGPWKVDELDGSNLDYWVALALGFQHAEDYTYWLTPAGAVIKKSDWNPSTEWALGGPIIERENIQLGPPTSRVHRNPGGNGQSGVWIACTWHRGVNGRRAIAHHETSPLIAAMRCFVKSKLTAADS